MIKRVLTVSILAAGFLAGQQLTWLGSMGTPYAEVHGVSSDGRVVAGWAGVYSPHSAWRWTPDSGMVDIGTLVPGRGAEAWGLSANGRVVVGYGLLENGTDYHGFRWENDSMFEFGTLGGSVSWAYGASEDGSVVAGSAELSNGFNRAFRWKADSGMQNLGVLPGAIRSVGRGISDDGGVVVGWSGFSNQVHHAFRWQNGVMADIHNSAFGQSEALGVSGNGNVVVGACAPSSFVPTWAFRWTEQTGMVNLGTLGGEWSEAWDANYDGTVVVGWAERSQGDWGAFRWTEGVGMEDLNTVYGHLLTPGSILRDAMAVSADGRFIAGRGYNSTTGRDEAYLLDTRGSALAEHPDDINFKLYPVSPNPCRSNAAITYELTRRASARLTISDVSGRTVALLRNGVQEAGSHTVSFNVHDLSGGIYFAKLTTGGKTEVQRLAVLK